MEFTVNRAALFIGFFSYVIACGATSKALKSKTGQELALYGVLVVPAAAVSIAALTAWIATKSEGFFVGDSSSTDQAVTTREYFSKFTDHLEVAVVGTFASVNLLFASAALFGASSVVYDISRLQTAKLLTQTVAQCLMSKVGASMGAERVDSFIQPVKDEALDALSYA